MMTLQLLFHFLQSSFLHFSAMIKVVLYVQVPPATIFMQEPQLQIPTAHLFILVLTQKEQAYLVCWFTSIFFTLFLKKAQ